MFAFTIRQLEVFLRVCDCRSFRKAADSLRISEASVSSQMRALERQLDCELFSRRRGAAITVSAAGQQLHDEVLGWVKEGIEIGRRMRRLPHQETFLRLYAGGHVLDDYLRPALPSFLEQNPDIHLTFAHYASRSQALAALKAGEVDGAVMTVRGEDELPGSALLSKVGSGVYGLPNLAEVAAERGLGALGFLVGEDDVSDIHAQRRNLECAGIEAVKVAGRYPIFDVGVRMALQGVGAIAIIDSIIEKRDPERRLVLIQELEEWERRLLLPANLPDDCRDRTIRFFEEVLGCAPSTQANAARPVGVGEAPSPRS